MLLADGLPVAAASGGKGAKNRNLLKPKPCPNCSESNKPDAKFCVKCKFVLSFDAFNEVTNEAEETKKKLAELEAIQKQQEERIKSISEIAMRQSFRVIEKEVEANPPPYIEGAENMTVQEVLLELQKRGCNTLAFDKVSDGVEA